MQRIDEARELAGNCLSHYPATEDQIEGLAHWIRKLARGGRIDARHPIHSTTPSLIWGHLSKCDVSILSYQSGVLAEGVSGSHLPVSFAWRTDDGHHSELTFDSPYDAWADWFEHKRQGYPIFGVLCH